MKKAKKKTKAESLAGLILDEQLRRMKHGVSAGGILVVACLSESRARNIAEVGQVHSGRDLEVKYVRLDLSPDTSAADKALADWLLDPSTGVADEYMKLLTACRKARGLS